MKFVLVEGKPEEVRGSEFPKIKMEMIRIRTEEDFVKFLETHTHIGPDKILQNGEILKRYKKND